MKKFAPPLMALIAITVLLEVIVQAGLIPSYLLPSPSEILKSFFENQNDLLAATLSTATNAIWGLIVASITGVLAAIVFSQNEFLKKALLPFAIFFQTVPIVAIAPLLVIWFGLGETTVRASSCIVAVFPILANTLLGLESSPQALRELFKLYNASRWQLLSKLLLPNAITYIVGGIKIAAGLAVIGTIVGEFVAGGGLGALIDSARTQQRPDLVFAAVILSTIVGLIFVVLINSLEKRIANPLPFRARGLTK